MIERVSKRFQATIGRFVLKYTAKYNRLIDPFDGSKPESYYSDENPGNRDMRLKQVNALMDNKKQAAEYNRLLNDRNIGLEVASILNEMLDRLLHLSILEESDRKELIQSARSALHANADLIRDAEEKACSGQFNEMDFDKMQMLLFRLLQKPIHGLMEAFGRHLESCTAGYSDDLFLSYVQQLMAIDAETEAFRAENALPEYSFSPKKTLPQSKATSYIPLELLGKDAVKEGARRECFARMRQVIAEMQPQMLPNGSGKTALLMAGTNAFRKYVERHKLLQDDEKNIVAVLRTKKGDDFVFTLRCMLNCNGKQTEYDEVDAFGDFYDDHGADLENSGIAFDVLTELCGTLDEYAERLRRQGKLIEIEATRKQAENRETRLAAARGVAAGGFLFGVPGAVVGGVVSKAITKHKQKTRRTASSENR